ncbi:hypothetical protein BD769DRAFT_1388569 [Suillus cothurnatus]|nr:hypothetical protein BD769DRAFT_1388569 [Suillus cothurnatus]
MFASLTSLWPVAPTRLIMFCTPTRANSILSWLVSSCVKWEGHWWLPSFRPGPSGGLGHETSTLFGKPIMFSHVEVAGVANISSCSPLSTRRVQGGIVMITASLAPRG